MEGYSGRFDGWKEAKGETAGYQAPEIAEKVAAATKKVLAGAALYERDAVTFDQREFSFPLATALLWVASKTQGQLRVLDFGGGLGTSYFQNAPFMNWVSNLEWVIVEQQSFLEQAYKLFDGYPLKFFSCLTEALQATRPQLALLSSSLQYVESPYEILKKIVDNKVQVIIIDRTIFSSEEFDYVTRQYVPKEIFQATIPTWIFSQKRFLEYMQKNYRLFSEFPAFKSTTSLDRDGRCLQELGYLFVLKNSAFDLALIKSSRGEH